MTTTNRIKAGTAYGCTTAGCNYPEGGCMDTCAFNLHRIDASLLKDDRAVMVAGNAEPDELPVQMHDDEDGPMKALAWAMLWAIGLGLLWLLYQVAPMFFGVFA